MDEPKTAPKFMFLATVQHYGNHGTGMRQEARCIVEAETASEAAAAIERTFEACHESAPHIIKLEQPVGIAGQELTVHVFGEF